MRKTSFNYLHQVIYSIFRKAGVSYTDPCTGEKVNESSNEVNTLNFSNGLTETTGEVELGGQLTKNTSLDLNSNELSASNGAVTLDNSGFELSNKINTVANQSVPQAGSKVIDSGTTFFSGVQDSTNLGGQFSSSVSAMDESTFTGSFVQVTKEQIDLNTLENGTPKCGIEVEKDSLKFTTPNVLDSTANAGQVLTLNGDNTAEFTDLVSFELPAGDKRDILYHNGTEYISVSDQVYTLTKSTANTITLPNSPLSKNSFMLFKNGMLLTQDQVAGDYYFTNIPNSSEIVLSTSLIATDKLYTNYKFIQ